MTTIEISQTGAKCSIPSSWDELSPDQVCHILQLYDKSVRLGWSLLDFNVRVLYYLMGIKYNWRSARWEKLADKAVVAERNANVYMLCEKCLGWLLKEYDDPDAEGNEKKRVLLAYNSVVNALPSIKPGLFHVGNHFGRVIRAFVGALRTRKYEKASIKSLTARVGLWYTCQSRKVFGKHFRGETPQ